LCIELLEGFDGIINEILNRIFFSMLEIRLIIQKLFLSLSESMDD
jgi:hypothetical protein